MKKSFVILLHVGFWFCYFMLIFIMLSVYFRSSAHTESQAPRIINALKSLFFFAFIPSVISYMSIILPKINVKLMRSKPPLGCR